MKDLNRYKVIISNKYVYQEAHISKEITRLSVGTGITDDIRLKKSSFFEEFSLLLYKQGEDWKMSCTDNIYFAGPDDRRIIIADVSHGKEYSLNYRSTDNKLLHISVQLDFDYEKKDFDCCCKVNDKKSVCIATANHDADLNVKSDYSNDEFIRLSAVTNGFKLEYLKSRFGIYKNGLLTQVGDVLHPTDFLSIAEISLYYDGKNIFVSDSKKIISNKLDTSYINKSECMEYPLFNRNTRLRIQPDVEPIEVLDPPTEPNKPRGNIIMKLMPALAMIALVIVVRGFMSKGSNMTFVIFSVCSMGIGVITSIVSFITDRKTYKAEVREREKQYTHYIEEKTQQIEKARKEEARILNEIYYDSEKEINIINEFAGELYDRLPTDSDFLSVRIGTGNQIARKEIVYKKQERFATSDQLVGIPEKLAGSYRYIKNAPITVDFKTISALGIIGDSEGVYEVIKVMVLDLISRQYSNELELVLMIPEEECGKYAWVRWIPHFYNKKLQVRNIVWNEESKNIIFEYLYSKLSSRKQNEIQGNNIIVLAVDDWGMKSHPISKFVESSVEVNTSFVFAERHQEMLPVGCDQILFIKDNGSIKMIDAKNRRQTYNINFSGVSDAAIVQIARKMAPVYCEEVSLENSLTKNITLYSLLNIFGAEDIDFKTRWKSTNIVRSMAAPIGVKTKGEVIYLDLHEKAHGPHGLVAGTTGSGKSEILQTYILSMVTLFHPYEVGFVIIDFKGGGMVNQFRNLPHLIGAITNIDGREINRSLLSIKAELQKRQRVFAEYGVNNINAYIELFKEHKAQQPLPHLILIVDEFAELKADQPEFMKELISASRIGRSLGVHLILATQKPSGQVSEQIWSNSKFKLCLKVQTREDSNEVIKSPLAAEIKEPGRAYLQVGNNELFELFQSAYSGARASNINNDASFEISRIELGGMKTVVYQQQKNEEEGNKETQLEAIVFAAERYCRENGIESLPNICLPPLETSIDYCEAERKAEKESLVIPMGIYDDPANQYQGELNLDISNDNLLIIGSTQMGKTNILHLILRYIGMNYSPDQVQAYIFDFASMTLKIFEKINHVGGVVIPGDIEKIKNLFKLLKASVEERKDKLLNIGVSSYGAYVEAGYGDLPRIIVLMDNFAVFKELYEETYESDFQFLTREGPSYGLHFIVTNARTAGFGYRYMANFGARLALSCTEKTEYSSIFERCRMEPKDTAGRILCKMDGEIYEAQTYMAFKGEKEVDRANSIKEFIESVNNKYQGKNARCIPYVPEILSMEYLRGNYKIDRSGYSYPIALDYSSVEIVWMNFSRMIDLCIIAKESDKRDFVINNLLKVIRYFAFEKSVKIYIVDSYERPLKQWEEFGYVDKYTIDNHEIDDMLEACMEEVEIRQEMLKDDGIDSVGKMPLLLYVFHSDDAVEYISESKELSSLYQKITKIARNLNVMFLFSNVEDVTTGYNSPALLKKLKENKRAIICQKLNDVKFFDIPISTMRAMKAHINGDAYYINGNEIQRIRMVDGREERG